MVDIMCLRQAYERREITKEAKLLGALKLLLDTNKVQIAEKEWVERT